MPYELPPMRPPSEAYSLLIRVMRGCPWNYCTFCSAYKGFPRKNTLRAVDEVKADIDELRQAYEEVLLLGYRREPKTAFLADSNAIIIGSQDLAEIVRYLRQTFPSIERVTSYGRAKTVLKKKGDELRMLREAGLDRLHLGIESGDDGVLERVRKGATANEMIEAGLRVKEVGFELSEYIMPGLGGRAASTQHAAGSARVLNAIEPHYIRVRPLMVVPGTPLYDEFERGEFERLSPYEIVAEIGSLVEQLSARSNLCFDHFANPPIFRQDWEGYRLPEEKPYLLELIGDALAAARQHKPAASS